MTRPAHGGARPGAGRPRGTGPGRTVKPVQFHLPPALIAAVECARGDLSRSEWVAVAILRALPAADREALAPSSWPASIAYAGARYHATGKVGHRADTGVPCAEYDLDGARVWLDALGAVRPE